MSWDAYRDNLIATTHCTQAAIVGHDGSVWATSDGLNITAEQGKALFAGFSNPNGIYNGITLGSTKYIYLRSDSEQIQGKKGTMGISCAKTNRCIVIGFYGDGMQAGNCRDAVEKLADYLKQSQY